MFRYLKEYLSISRLVNHTSCSEQFDSSLLIKPPRIRLILCEFLISSRSLHCSEITSLIKVANKVIVESHSLHM